MKQHWPIIVLAIVMVVINWSILHSYPVARVSGDEPGYVKLSHGDSSYGQKLSRLLPGNMRFEWQPPLPYSIYGLLAGDQSLIEAYQKNQQVPANPFENERVAAFCHRISLLNLLLFLLIGANVYIISLLLGFGRPAAVLASCLVWFDPALVFYVGALWPEFLHLALLSSAMLLLVLFGSRDKLRLLAPAGILLGYCALTKGVAGWYMVFLVPIVAYCSFVRLRESLPARVRAVYSLKAAAILLGCYLVVVYPQKTANFYKHNVFAISTNTWINVECGLIPAQEVGGDTFPRYFKASPDLKLREERSRDRVMEYLRRPTVTMPQIIANQLNMFISNQLNNSFLVREYQAKRWGDKISTFPYGTIAINIGILMAWTLFLGGMLGIVRRCCRSLGCMVLVVYVLYYCGSLLVVGWNSRFFVQVMPFLAILSAAGLLGCVRDHSAPGPRTAGRASAK
jgi:hypothetical protein